MIMRDLAADILTLKASAAVATLGSIMGAFFVPGATVPFFNVSPNTFGMSVAGSLLAFAYGTPIESRKKLYGYAIGGIFVGIWGMQFLLWRGVDIHLDYRPAVAGAIALGSRWIIPFIIENIPVLWNRIFHGIKIPGDHK